MKRGLKLKAIGDFIAACDVEESAPMKRGLKQQGLVLFIGFARC